jgi:heat shock protein HslJ
VIFVIRLMQLASLLLAVSACAKTAEPVSTAADAEVADTVSLLSTRWQVEDIDQVGIIDSSMITIEFRGPENLAGSAGCNRYFGVFEQTGDRISVSPLGLTRMACAEALMNQERRFVDAMAATARFAIENDNWLVFYDAAGTERVRALAIAADAASPPAPKPAPQPLDAAATASLRFDCRVPGLQRFREPPRSWLLPS